MTASPIGTRVRARELIQENVARDDRVAESYDSRHPEINNPTEQARCERRS